MIKKILKNIFSQKALYILLMLIQIGTIAAAIYYLRSHFTIIYALIIVIDIVLIVSINNSRNNPAYKMMWIVLIAILPIYGGIAYLFVKNQVFVKILSKNQTKRLLEIKKHLP